MRRSLARRMAAPLSLSVLILLSVGCTAATGGAQPVDSTLDDIHRQLFKLQKDAAARARVLDEVRDAVSDEDGSDREALADLGVKVDQLAHEMLVLGEQVRETQDQVRTLVDEIRLARRLPPPPAGHQVAAAPGGSDAAGDEPSGSGPSLAAPTTTPAEPQDWFNRAYADYGRKDYQLAAWEFGEFLRTHPDSSLSDDAQFWIGECLFAEGDHEGAVQAFQVVIDRYVDGDKVPAAHLRSGMAYLQLRQTKEAVLQLQHVLDAYPGTDEARMARAELQQRGLARN